MKLWKLWIYFWYRAWILIQQISSQVLPHTLCSSYWYIYPWNVEIPTSKQFIKVAVWAVCCLLLFKVKAKEEVTGNLICLRSAISYGIWLVSNINTRKNSVMGSQDHFSKSRSQKFLVLVSKVSGLGLENYTSRSQALRLNTPMGIGRGAGGPSPPGYWNYEQKKVVFSIARGKNQISPLLPPPGKNLGKSPTGPPWKKSFRRPWILQWYCLVEILQFNLFSDCCICR